MGMKRALVTADNSAGWCPFKLHGRRFPMNEMSSPMVTTDPKQATNKMFAPPHEVAPNLLLHAS